MAATPKMFARFVAIALVSGLALAGVGCDGKSKLEGTWAGRMPGSNEGLLLHLENGFARLHVVSGGSHTVLLGTYRVRPDGVLETQLVNAATGMRIVATDRFSVGDNGLTLAGLADGTAIHYMRVK